MNRISLVVDVDPTADLVDFYASVREPIFDLGSQLHSEPAVSKCVLVFEEVI